MSTRHLEHLLRPGSLALIGASTRPSSLGSALLANIHRGGFPGRVYAVNPHGDAAGTGAAFDWVRSIGELPEAPDLAIVATPASKVPSVVAELGAIGTRCAIILSAGVKAGLSETMLAAARAHDMRIIGPNCLGVIAPHARLDAGFARAPARAGRIALIAQSGALVTAMLDWADARGIGFSGVVSCGEMADTDIADLVDLFAADPLTDAILLHIEGLTDAAAFLSSARAAAARKPVVAIKAGRSPAAAAATLTHSGRMAGAYDVYRAAFERAGIVTVDRLEDLLGAAEILSCHLYSEGSRLAIVTNGGGAAILAVDALGGTRARLATLTAATTAALDAALPPGWSRANPVDVLGDALPARFGAAVEAVLRADEVDAVLAIHCPTAMASAADFAAAVGDAARATRAAGPAKPVLACWLGEANRAAAGPCMRKAGIPLFDTPEAAIAGLGLLLDTARARGAAAEIVPAGAGTDAARCAARAVIARARSDHRTLLTAIEAKAVLAAYGIAVVPTHFAAAPEVVEDSIGGLVPPYAVKIASPDLSHKSDAGGVALDVPSRKAAAAAACRMEMAIRASHPAARIDGFTIEPMVRRPHAHELIAGIATDPLFGRLLLFGAGGIAAELIADRTLALPPLADAAARRMISQTRIARLLAGYRSEPAAHIDAIATVLTALSAIAADLPEIAELDINPLLADVGGAVALDARICLAADGQDMVSLALRPPPGAPASTAPAPARRELEAH